MFFFEKFPQGIAFLQAEVADPEKPEAPVPRVQPEFAGDRAIARDYAESEKDRVKLFPDVGNCRVEIPGRPDADGNHAAACPDQEIAELP
jgi:hypothetical protein